MMFHVKRTVFAGLVILSGVAGAAPAVAQEAGAAGADNAGADSAGADNAGAGPTAGSHGGGGGASGGPAALGGRTSYDLVQNDAGQACSLGRGPGSPGFGLLLGALTAVAVARRRRSH